MLRESIGNRLEIDGESIVRASEYGELRRCMPWRICDETSRGELDPQTTPQLLLNISQHRRLQGS